jgi:spoIIIJ-associated protein
VLVTEPEPDNIEISFQGFDLPLLLGHNAELLDALQYIARRAFAPAVASGIQIDFDANGYRDARKEELQLMAQKAAERVKTSKVPFVFDPMSAQDRRAIHTALVDIEGIRTESEGDGQMRRVKVLPA